MEQKNIIDKEILIDKTITIVSKSDPEGIITYVNDAFIEVSAYSRVELIGEPHNLLRHPDMPKVIFKKLWEALNKGENFHLITKNLRKDGCYYWIVADFYTDINQEDNTIKGYTARRKYVPSKIKEKIIPFYKDLLEIEKVRGEEASALYFDSFLREEVGKSYNDYIIDLFEEEMKLKEKIKKEESIKRRMSWFFLTEYEEI